MKKKELTRKQLASVPCPTCGVTVAKGCILYSGGLRSEPHRLRKLAAIDAIEEK
jgi:predicted transporter